MTATRFAPVAGVLPGLDLLATGPGVHPTRVPRAQVATTTLGPLVVRDAGGSGRPVVLIHGMGADGLLNWLTAFEPLVASGYRPIAVDQPGHGGSPRVGKFSLESSADAIAEVAAAVGPGVVVAGYSMGGPVSQLLAHRHPGVAVGLIEGATGAYFGEGRRTPGPPRPETDRDRPRSPRAVAPPVHGDRIDLLEHVRWQVRTASTRSSFEAGMALGRYDARPWVGRLGIPVTSLLTLRDHAVRPREQWQLAAFAGAAVLRLDAGHTGTMRARFGTAMVEAVRILEERLP